MLVLAAALALGLGAAFRFLRPASLGERIGVAEGASLRLVVVERSNGGGHGSHESSEPALLAELSSLLAAAYTVTVYSAPAEEGRTFGVDSQGRVYQDNRRYSASPEQAEELTALLERICS